MLKYCQILNEETGLVSIAAGTNEEYYKSIGMTKENVEQSDVNGLWYLRDKCPHKPEVQKLQEAKEAKYQEALDGAKNFIETEAAYQFDENNHIEATDGNIGKMTAYALGFQTGTIQTVSWTSKEDNVLILTANDVLRILTGLGEIQSDVWNVQFVDYKNAIEEASTVEQVNAIVVNYEE
jgi:hypothetical protein